MNTVLKLGVEPNEVTLKYLCNGKLSVAIQAMVDGLRKQSSRDDFKVDMFSFGHAKNDVCYGCAATCAVMQLTKTNLTAENIIDHRYTSNDSGSSRVWPLMKRVDIEEFENAINSARDKSMRMLCNYLGVKISRIQRFRLYLNGFGMTPSMSVKSLAYMNNDNWEECLSRYEEFARVLKKLGL